MGAAAAGVSALGTTAIKSYADYEQLVGGIETLFGAGGAASVQEYAKNVGKSVDEVRDEFDTLMEAQTLAMDNANNAYASAGLSANEYMETVTSFAASLKASTANEVEAADAANQAVIDMADNANKMGTSMESIQNAYQGFAKQNYTMLDNLKLGYGGTKEEMQRLLADAEKLSGIKYDISSLSDVYSAIHVIQNELGITGTTAKEASTTISGSLNAMKASWSNLLVGIADDNQDFDALVNNFVESTVTAGENLLPRIETTISGFGTLIDSLLPEIMSRVPAIINDVLPDLVQAGINVIGSLINGIEQNLPQIMDSADVIIDQFVTALLEMAPQLVEVAVQLIGTLAQGIIDNLPALVTAAGEIADAILDGIGDLCPALEPVTDAIKVLLDNMDKVIPVVETLTAVFIAWKAVFTINTLIEKYNKITKDMTIVQYAAKTAQELLNASFLSCPVTWIVMAIAALVAIFVILWNKCDWFREFWIELWETIKEAASTALDAIIGFFTETIPEFIQSIIDWFSELPERLSEWGENVKQTVTTAISDMITNVVTFFSELPEKIMYWLGFVLMSIVLWGADLIDWVAVNIPIFVENIVTFVSELPGKIAGFLGEIIGSVIAWGNNMRLKAIETGTKFVDNVVNFIKTLPGKIAGFLEDVIGKVVGFASNMKTKATEAGRGFFDNIVSALTDLPNKMSEIGGQIVNGIMTGISNGWGKLVDYVKNLANSLFQGAKDALEIHSPSRKFKWLAEMCVAGFDEGMDGLMNTDSMTRNINASMSTVQANMSGARTGGSIGGFGSFNQTINVNQQISTPDELARIVRLESRYGLMRGVAFG